MANHTNEIFRIVWFSTVDFSFVIVYNVVKHTTVELFMCGLVQE